MFTVAEPISMEVDSKVPAPEVAVPVKEITPTCTSTPFVNLAVAALLSVP